jgi:hypothetical protein
MALKTDVAQDDYRPSVKMLDAERLEKDDA